MRNHAQLEILHLLLSVVTVGKPSAPVYILVSVLQLSFLLYRLFSDETYETLLLYIIFQLT